MISGSYIYSFGWARS